MSVRTLSGIEALAAWYQEGTDPPGGWRPGWKTMVRRYLKTGNVPPPPKPAVLTKTVDPDVQHARLTACGFCEHVRAETRRCSICGCAAVIDELVKRPWHQCPVGRWTRAIASL